MPKYKRNHFISQGLIKFWQRPNGQVLLWDRRENSSLDFRNPKSVHYREYLYATWDTDGNRDMSAEHFLRSEIDDRVPELVEKIASNWPNVLPLAIEDRDFLLNLIVRTILRHPTIPNLSKSSIEVRFASLLIRASRWLDRKNGRDAAYERYGRDRVLSSEIMSLAAKMDVEPLISQIENRQIGLFALEEGSPNLVLGTQPFLLNPHGKDTDIKAGLVIHPRILIGILAIEGDDFVGVLSKDDVYRINGLFIRQSRHLVLVNGSDIDGAWFDEYQSDGTSERQYISVAAKE